MKATSWFWDQPLVTCPGLYQLLELPSSFTFYPSACSLRTHLCSFRRHLNYSFWPARILPPVMQSTGIRWFLCREKRLCKPSFLCWLTLIDRITSLLQSVAYQHKNEVHKWLKSPSGRKNVSIRVQGPIFLVKQTHPPFLGIFSIFGVFS